MRDSACLIEMFVRLYGEMIHEFERVDYRPYRRVQTMLYLTYTMVFSVDIARFGLYPAKDLDI